MWFTAPLWGSFLVLLMSGQVVWATVPGDSVVGNNPVALAIIEHVRQHPSIGQRTHRIRFTDRRIDLPACSRVVTLESESRQKFWGQVHVKVRCEGQPRWHRKVGLYVAVLERHVAASRLLLPGTVLTQDDLTWEEADLSKTGEGLLTTMDGLVGMQVRRPVSSRAPLKLSSLSAMTVIKKGSVVKLTLKGVGFEILTTGRAMGNASIGGTLQVLVKEGRTIEAQAQGEGVAEAYLD